MTNDISVAEMLRSELSLVVIEAPAGCGKTYQGASYAKDIAPSLLPARLLILTHTHAARAVFSERTSGVRNNIEIKTIDGLVNQIAGMYHKALDLPSDTAAWARDSGQTGFKQLAGKAASLLVSAPVIARAIAARYPIIICDEHQDCNTEQHDVIMAIHKQGAKLRIFGDPMQRIYGESATIKLQNEDDERWNKLKEQSDCYLELDYPHRWKDKAFELGQWILDARKLLRNGQKISLKAPLPKELSVITAVNLAEQKGAYRIAQIHREPFNKFILNRHPFFILSRNNEIVHSLRSFFDRKIPIWEGHQREALYELVKAYKEHTGCAVNITSALVEFVQKVAKGFSNTGFADRLKSEVANGCVEGRKSGSETKPVKLRRLGKHIINAPNHKGGSLFLQGLFDFLRAKDTSFRDVEIDYPREFWDAIRLGEFEDPATGLLAITQRRTHTQPQPPKRVISTIHKSKGLERDHILILPCDRVYFTATEKSRRLLYVAMSRATNSLTLVIDSSNPSPLFEIN